MDLRYLSYLEININWYQQWPNGGTVIHQDAMFQIILDYLILMDVVIECHLRGHLILNMSFEM
jgi:hypothetical protein